jgi:hypothetical protein
MYIYKNLIIELITIKIATISSKHILNERRLLTILTDKNIFGLDFVKISCRLFPVFKGIVCTLADFLPKMCKQSFSSCNYRLNYPLTKEKGKEW